MATILIKDTSGTIIKSYALQSLSTYNKIECIRPDSLHTAVRVWNGNTWEDCVWNDTTSANLTGVRNGSSVYYLENGKYNISYQSTLELYLSYDTNVDIDAYIFNGEFHEVDKRSHLLNKQTLNGIFRDGFNLLMPTLLVYSQDLPSFNYVYINNLHRYYFLTGVASVVNSVWEISLAVDPLNSNRSQIMNITAMVERAENFSDMRLIDSEAIVKPELAQIMSRQSTLVYPTPTAEHSRDEYWVTLDEILNMRYPDVLDWYNFLIISTPQCNGRSGTAADKYKGTFWEGSQSETPDLAKFDALLPKSSLGNFTYICCNYVGLQLWQQSNLSGLNTGVSNFYQVYFSPVRFTQLGDINYNNNIYSTQVAYINYRNSYTDSLTRNGPFLNDASSVNIDNIYPGEGSIILDTYPVHGSAPEGAKMGPRLIDDVLKHHINRIWRIPFPLSLQNEAIWKRTRGYCAMSIKFAPYGRWDLPMDYVANGNDMYLQIYGDVWSGDCEIRLSQVYHSTSGSLENYIILANVNLYMDFPTVTFNSTISNYQIEQAKLNQTRAIVGAGMAFAQTAAGIGGNVASSIGQSKANTVNSTAAIETEASSLGLADLDYAEINSNQQAGLANAARWSNVGNALSGSTNGITTQMAIGAAGRVADGVFSAIQSGKEVKHLKEVQGNPAPSVSGGFNGRLMDSQPILFYTMPDIEDPNPHYKGLPYHKNIKLETLAKNGGGFIQISNLYDSLTVNTLEEKEMIINSLKNGVILPDLRQ